MPGANLPTLLLIRKQCSEISVKVRKIEKIDKVLEGERMVRMV